MSLPPPDIIVAGSAVSFLDDVAPGVGDFIDELLRGLAATCDHSPSRNGAMWFSALTRAVVDRRGELVRAQSRLVGKLRKSYKRLLKFEEVLRLAELCGINPQELVTSAYSISSFNLNHAALAYLATTGRYEILTTNFDNGIELAGKLKVDLIRPHGESKSGPIHHAVVKMHGCALGGSIVATTSMLLTAQDTKRYKFIEKLCERRTVSLFGYSGRGDVDIAPHLSAAAKKSTMLWFNHKCDTPPFDGAEFRLGDLTKREPRANPLLHLAVSKGWIVPDGLRGGKWNPQPLREVIGKIPPDQAARFLAQIWGSVDSQLHLAHYLLDFKLCEDPIARNQFVSWYVESTTDLPPSRTGDNAEVLCMACAAREVDATFADRWEAFAHWRKGNPSLAQGMVSRILTEGGGKAQDRLHSASLGLAIVSESLWCARPYALHSVLSSNEMFLRLCEEEVGQLIEEDHLDLEVQMVARRNLLHIAIWRAALAIPRDEGELSSLHEALRSLTERSADLQLWEVYRNSERLYRALQRKFRIQSALLRPTKGPRHLRSVQTKKSIAYFFPLRMISSFVYKLLERDVMPLLQLFPALERRMLARKLRADLYLIDGARRDSV